MGVNVRGPNARRGDGESSILDEASRSLPHSRAMPTPRVLGAALALTIVSGVASSCAPSSSVLPAVTPAPVAAASVALPLPIASLGRPRFAPPPPPPPPPDGWTGAYSSEPELDHVRWWDREAPGDLGVDWQFCRKPGYGTSYVGDPPCGYMR